MKILVVISCVLFLLVACGPSSEEIERQRLEDSVKAEHARITAIEEANRFITDIESEKNDSVEPDNELE